MFFITYDHYNFFNYYLILQGEIQYQNVTYTYGAMILKTKGMFTETHWYWICIGVLIGYSVVFNTFCCLALAYLNGIASSSTKLS